MKNLKKSALLVGCGISNASLACMLKNTKKWVIEIHEKLDNVGGMLSDFWDNESNCWVSCPHIIHAKPNNETAIKWLRRHTKLVPFKHKVLCIGDGSFSMWPLNLAYKELFEFMNPNKDIEEEFVNSYSKKMWGQNYKEILSSGVNKRFKFKESRNSDFFENQVQFQPTNGYTNMIKDLIVDCKVVFNSSLDESLIDFSKWDLVVLSSPIDEFFNFKHGKLEFKGLKFIYKKIKTDGSNLLTTPVINLPTHKNIIRVTESNQLQSKDNNSKTRVLVFDIPSDENRFYPVMTDRNKNIFDKYMLESQKYKNLILNGRCASFVYRDIDDCIMNSLNIFNKMKGGEKNEKRKE